MHAKLYCDGGNLGKNPSPEGVYWSVAREHDDGRIERLTERATSDRYQSNNCAEYLALHDALFHATKIPGVTKLTVHSDSQLIVNQFNGRNKITGEELRTLCKAAQDAATYLINGGVQVEVIWVGRKENVKRLGH